MSMRSITNTLPLLLLTFAASFAYGQGTGFSYQGRLTSSGNAAAGTSEMQFRLFDAADVGSGTQQGAAIINNSVLVANGVFTVQLDFGANVFDGSARFLEIGVRTSGSPNPFTVLAPRQPITATPYALKSLNAIRADGLSVACVNCVTSSQIQAFSGSAVTGTIPLTSVPAGSANYIQNTSTQQASSNFNISGNGVVGGRLGIGTASPDRNLTVRGGGGAYLNVKDNSSEVLMGADSTGGILSTMTNNDLQLRAGGNDPR